MQAYTNRFVSLATFCKKVWESFGAPGGDKCRALSVAPYPHFYHGLHG
jgi:hypothetical protein